MRRRNAETRGDRNCRWIETFCVRPSGRYRGQRVRLSPGQGACIIWCYDQPDGPQRVPIAEKDLSAFISLLHLCGVEAKQGAFRPQADVDVFTLWAACGPELQAVLERKGGRVICPELGTAYPVAA